MGIELIGDKNPARQGVGGNGLVEMFTKVSFGARVADRGSYDLSRRDLNISHQTLRAVTDILKFTAFNQPRSRG